MRSEAINLDVLKEKIGNISNRDSSYIEEWVDSFLICKSDKQLKRFVDKHGGIDHIVKIAGIDHVGIGCDFDGGGGIEGVFDASEVMNITIGLVKRGYTEEEIEKIWGGNLIRVFKDVQAVAEKIQAEQTP